MVKKAVGLIPIIPATWDWFPDFQRRGSKSSAGGDPVRMASPIIVPEVIADLIQC